MNIILLTSADFITSDRVVLRDRRFQYMQKVHQVQLGSTVRVGLCNGLMGLGEVIRLEQNELELKAVLTQPPPPKLPVTLILALPRPKMLRRIVQAVSSMGVPRLILLNAQRVEKSFWQTPFLDPSSLQEQLLLGLEQARDTQLPEIRLEKRFKPFVEDCLPAIVANSLGLVGHPGAYPDCPRGLPLTQPVTLAIGPEGGWTPYEVDKFCEVGLQPVQLGSRILRVETAVTALLARLF